MKSARLGGVMFVAIVACHSDKGGSLDGAGPSEASAPSAVGSASRLVDAQTPTDLRDANTPDADDADAAFDAGADVDPAFAAVLAECDARRRPLIAAQAKAAAQRKAGDGAGYAQTGAVIRDTLFPPYLAATKRVQAAIVNGKQSQLQTIRMGELMNTFCRVDRY